MGSRLDGWLVGEVEERRAWKPFGDDEALVAWRLPCSVLRRCCGGPNEQTDKGRVATSSQGRGRAREGEWCLIGRYPGGGLGQRHRFGIARYGETWTGQ